MSITLAFDVYGTLIDTHGIDCLLEKLAVKNVTEFSQTWRNKQLEYSFRRGLMQHYQSFAVCTKDALDYTCRFYKAALTTAQKQQLLDAYKTLPAFDDVPAALSQLKDSDIKMYAFSNGSLAAVEQLLESAGIKHLFDGVVSCESLQSFKPNPAVYRHFLQQAKALASDTWLISSNPFDVIGAISFGMHSAWVQRSEQAIFDPWGIEPTTVVKSLSELNVNVFSINQQC
ncbi:haloacid dehalogenase type II [Agarivorans sp. MS3-6]|uniref:haloacid dehalogenase type II n=1 Tax=Agarivorans sp. TSD2052 TaxID=2937286 RepID=UPI00200F2069|nr:haloacid dehalogenase type II [Agarivorans sp. TSD2052]UPW17038.1 haloacid dehalogenase type II [Agarivorans sp. TSD2052]